MNRASFLKAFVAGFAALVVGKRILPAPSDRMAKAETPGEAIASPTTRITSSSGWERHWWYYTSTSTTSSNATVTTTVYPAYFS